MSVHVFGGELLLGQPMQNTAHYYAIDVGDVFTNPLNGATVTITAITVPATVGGTTSIAYTKTGTFTASPATLTVFKGWLMASTLVRTSYRGGAATAPQWPVSMFDEAGLSVSELKLPQ